MSNQYELDLKDLKDRINNLSCDVRIAMSLSDKRIKIRNIIIVILSVSLIGLIVAFFAYEKSMETVEKTTTTTETYTIDQDSETGNNNYIGRDGNISYGEAKDYNN